MIGCKQIKPEMALSASVGAYAVFQQLWQPIFDDSILPPFVVFGNGSLKKCIGYAKTGTFTAEIYLDDVLVFIVTESDTSTPVELEYGQTGLLANPSLIKCTVTSASSDLEGLYIYAYDL
jgi:hypothetical protein